MVEVKNSNEQARLARQKTDTPEDRRITKLVFDLLKTPWAKETARSVQRKMVLFFDFAFTNVKDPEKIRTFFEETLAESAKITRANIASGKEHLAKIKNEKAVILVTNHFGFYKATMVPNENHRYPIDLDKISPFPVRLIPIYPLAKKLNWKLYETALELPAGLLEIQEACNGITIPNTGEGRTQILIDKVEAIPKQNIHSLIVMYPEGGTSGKKNMGDPYDLDEFHPGAFAVAAKTGLPIIPACQYFNPDKGFGLHILEPIFLSETDTAKIREITEKTQQLMQAKLKELSQAK